MGNAFSRFKRSPIWTELCKEINENNNGDITDRHRSISAIVSSQKIRGNKPISKAKKTGITTFRSNSAPIRESPDHDVNELGLVSGSQLGNASASPLSTESPDILPSQTSENFYQNTSIDLMRVATNSA